MSLPRSILERRREVATILRRAVEGGRFSGMTNHDEVEAVARGLIDPEFEDVEIYASRWLSWTDQGGWSFCVNGQWDELDLDVEVSP